MSVVVEQDYANARLIVVMGTCGCGKSTIGELLALRCNAEFIEGDSLHTLKNKAKMEQGIALTDEDRWPWLASLGEAMRADPTCTSRSEKIIASCSALKRSYRELITKSANEPVLYVYLQGSKELLQSRLSGREGHFMDANLLDSQLDTLETPSIDEFSFTVDIDASIADLVDQIVFKIS